MNTPLPYSETQRKILDAAEKLFITKGFSATSLRAVATNAGVNLAATNYHFGSKEGLYAATIHRVMDPINIARLKNLETLQNSKQTLTLEGILHVFFSPLLHESNTLQFPHLMSRLYAEPESLTRPILQGEFGEVMMRYLDALDSVLPNVNTDELTWRFHFMIGSMNHLLNFTRPMTTKPAISAKERMEKLINFVAAGLRQN